MQSSYVRALRASEGTHKTKKHLRAQRNAQQSAQSAARARVFETYLKTYKRPRSRRSQTQTKTPHKQRSFFGRSETLSKAPITATRTRAWETNQKHKLNARGPGAFLQRTRRTSEGTQQTKKPLKETCSGAAKRSAEHPKRRACGSIEECSNINNSNAQQRAGRNRCSSASEHSVSRPSSREPTRCARGCTRIAASTAYVRKRLIALPLAPQAAGAQTAY